MGVWEKVIKWIYKKSAEVSAYEMIDGYVSKPGGRGDEDVQVEARSLSGAPGFDKGKLVDKLVEGAKARRAKAAKQRAEGKTDLADRTEAQARSLEVAAHAINKELPAAEQRQVQVTPKPGETPLAEPEEKPEGGPHTAIPRPGNRPALLLAGGGILAVLMVGLVLLIDGGDDDGGGGGDGSSSTEVGGQSSAGSATREAISPTEASGLDKLVTDPNRRLHPVVRGKIEYHSPKANFSQRFIGRYPAANCDAYGRNGLNGTFSTPYILYPTDTKLKVSMNVGVTIKGYTGSGNYDNSGPALTGSIGARGENGSSLGTLSAANFSEVKFTAAKDAGGRIYFSGDDLQNRGDTVNGQMYWICSDERIDVDAYQTNPY